MIGLKKKYNILIFRLKGQQQQQQYILPLLFLFIYFF